MDPAERRLKAQLAAYTLHSRVDGTAHTAPARAAFERRFFDEVDPQRELPEAERNRRAAAARKAYYARLSAAALKARRDRRGDDDRPAA